MKGHKLSYLLSGILFIAAFVAMFYERSKRPVFQNDGGVWALFAGGFILWMVGYAEQRKKEKNNK
jgi:ascorbate-specific PTS system EIIC-type component UlaA